MCGIVGITGKKKVLAQLLSGLRQLEYRGYDSAGVGLQNGKTACIKAVGKVEKLASACQSASDANIGIAHTRWATHGKPTLDNAHPHTSGQYTLVHNGIIENAEQLKQDLTSSGSAFYSDTDSEVIVKLLDHNNGDIQKTLSQLEGSYALAILDDTKPGQIVAAKYKSPLVIAQNSDACAVASDISALQNNFSEFIYMEDGDIAVVSADEFNITQDGDTVSRASQTINQIAASNDKSGFDTYMEKEIYDQFKILPTLLSQKQNYANLLKGIDLIQIVACGTSYHAGLVASYWFESNLNIKCCVDIASDYRYRNPTVMDNALLVVISQSGETADTLAVLENAKQFGFLKTLAICNVAHSSMTRLADDTILTNAGPEYGVASTKAFTTQLIALGKLSNIPFQNCQPEFSASNYPKAIIDAAKTLEHKKSALFIARGELYPIAMEGALKLKELSYIHAEAYPGGELKHGPLALVDKDMPVIALLNDDELFPKMLSNIEEVISRDGDVILFAAESLKEKLKKDMNVIYIHVSEPLLSSIHFSIALQLLAFHTARLKGLNVDQPRNLAKSVTVE